MFQDVLIGFGTALLVSAWEDQNQLQYLIIALLLFGNTITQVRHEREQNAIGQVQHEKGRETSSKKRKELNPNKQRRETRGETVNKSNKKKPLPMDVRPREQPTPQAALQTQKHSADTIKKNEVSPADMFAIQDILEPNPNPWMKVKKRYRLSSSC